MIASSPSRATTGQVVFLLACGQRMETRRAAEDLAVAICDEARRRGWRSIAHWSEAGVRLWLQNGDSARLREYVESMTEKARAQGTAISILDEQPDAFIRALEDGPIAWGTVIHARLTRELLCALPEGAFVASDSSDANCRDSLGPVGPLADRAQRWQHAQRAGMDGSMSRVLWSQADYEAFCMPTPADAGVQWR